MYLHEGFPATFEKSLTGPTPEQADLVIQDMERFIRDIYMPFRGAEGYKTERAILPEPANAPHQENDAEHTMHIEKTVQFLYGNKEAYGLSFPFDFNINKARNYASTHDIMEVFAGDVDALTKDKFFLSNKGDKEEKAAKRMRREYPELSCIVDEWEEYEKKSSPESQFVSDVDKIAATLVICADGGRRWHNWQDDYGTIREDMCKVIKDKLKTQNGMALYEALERRLDASPELFPAVIHTRDRLFDDDPYKTR